VRRLDVGRADADEGHHEDHLEQHHRGVQRGALAHAAHEHDGERRHDHHGRQVEAHDERAERRVQRGRDGAQGRIVRDGLEVRRHPRGEVDAEGAAQERAEIVGPALRDVDVADGVLDDEVPADDPGEDLAERDVGVGVGAARDRHEGRDLRVAERAQAARDGREQVGQHDRRAGARVVGAAGRHHAHAREDAGAHDGPDAQQRQIERAQRAAQAPRVALGPLAHRDVGRLAAQELGELIPRRCRLAARASTQKRRKARTFPLQSRDDMEISAKGVLFALLAVVAVVFIAIWAREARRARVPGERAWPSRCTT